MTTIYLFTYIISVGISFLLSSFLFSTNKKSPTILFLAYAGIVVGIWFLLELFIKFFGFNEFYSLFAWKIIIVLRYVAVYFFTLFILALTGKTLSRILSTTFILGGILLSILVVFTDKVYVSVAPSILGGYDHVLGEWAYYILPTIGFSLLIAGYFLLQYLLGLKKGSRLKRQVSYIFIGSIFIFAGALMDDIGFPFLGITYFNIVHVTIAIFSVMIFYIIYQLEAFEIGILKFKIRHKVLMGILIAALIPILIIYFTNFRTYQNTLTSVVLERARIEIKSHAIEINTRFDRYESEVIFLAALLQSCGCLEEETKENYTELAHSFTHMMESSDFYMQIRYIDEFGNEIIRVDSVNGVATRIAKENLQNKSDRYYFSNTIILNKGEVFASPVDLNREGSPPEIEIPYNSVIRYSTPVFDSENNKRGIVITNIFASSFLVGYQIHEEHTDFLVDSDGYYLSHNKYPEKNWGGPKDLNTEENVKQDFPEVFDQLLSGATGSIIYEGDVFSYFSIYPTGDDKDYFLVAVELNPRELIFGPIDRLRIATYLSLLISILIVLTIGYYIARTISNPINRLHRSIEAVRHGDLEQKIIVNSQDEVGDLARAYSDMLFAVKQSREDIEQKVRDQTKDINRQKDEIAIERDKLDTTLKSIGDGVFVIDTDRKINLFNEAMEKISGYSADEVLGKVCSDVLKFVKEGTDEEIEDCVSNVISKGTLQTMKSKSELIRKDGSRVAVADSAAPIKDQEENIVGAIIVIRDDTKERAIDRAKSEFVSTASHQLRTPLVAIRWVIERFIKEEKLTAIGKSYLSDIEKSMIRLIELVDALLNVSRLESSGGVSIIPKAFEVVSYVREFIDENRPLIDKKKLNIVYENKPEKLDIITDESTFTNILQSIVSNAIEYTPDEGEIEVSIEKKDNRFILVIRDTGIGIPKDEQDKIFTKFSRASNAKLIKTDGTGLGLYVAKQAVELLGGKIWFESEENKGTIFYIDLPIESKAKEGEKKLT